MRSNCKSLILLAAMVCSVSAASARGSLRRRLEMDMQQQLDLAALDLVASPEAALHSEFLKEAVYEKGGGKSSDTKKGAKAPKGRKTPAPSPLFEQPTGGGSQPPAPTNAPTFPLVSLPSTRPPTFKKTKQPTVEKTKQPTVEKTKQPTVEKTKSPTVEKTKNPTVEKTKSPTVEKTKNPTVEKTKNPTVEKTKGKNGQPSGGSKAPSPTKAPSPQEKTKGKTSKGEGNNGGDKGKKGDSEVTEPEPEAEPEDVTAVGKVAGGESFFGK
jgi:hypothetical protein